jgi:hypothetical protein
MGGRYIEITRSDYRKEHGSKSLVSAPTTGNLHTCALVDAVWHLRRKTRMRQERLTHEQLRAPMPEEGATRFVGDSSSLRHIAAAARLQASSFAIPEASSPSELVAALRSPCCRSATACSS